MNQLNQIEKLILQFTQRRIKQLYPSKASLAKLRRGIGKQMGEMPELLGFTLPEERFSPYTTQEEQIEQALYTAITLYAFHQQGQEACVSISGTNEEQATTKRRNSFGYAMQRLSSCVNTEDTVLRRFNKVMTANSLEELATHVRSLIGLMKQHNIMLDYPLFAVALYRFQQPEVRRSVVLDWGKDYYMGKERETNDEGAK